jgi:Ca2+-transporting ATPase
LTAKSIAARCGIFTDGVAIEGPDYRVLTQTQKDEIIPRLQVMARCSPDDKLSLVKRLRELGEVVAVTGDGNLHGNLVLKFLGTNDAPILTEADVGFSMGIAGTEVAKDASDSILSI